MPDKNNNTRKDGENEPSNLNVGGIIVQVGEIEEVSTPSVKDLESELRDGGIEVVEGRKSPEEDLSIT